MHLAPAEGAIDGDEVPVEGGGVGWALHAAVPRHWTAYDARAGIRAGSACRAVTGRSPMPNESAPQRRTGVPAFDPVAPFFTAQDRRPDDLAAVAAADLSPLQRALLVTDGTVTTLLAAWALEPVNVQPLGQRAITLAADGPPAAGWLEAPPGSALIERAVVLEGGTSRRLFAYAESLICADRLPVALRSGLESGRLSLGQLLLMPGLQSRREGLWYGRERPAHLPPAVAARAPAEFLARTYRVTSGTRPLMVITERFPWSFRA
jgi:chorismate-pyruvate lyase